MKLLINTVYSWFYNLPEYLWKMRNFGDEKLELIDITQKIKNEYRFSEIYFDIIVRKFRNMIL